MTNKNILTTAFIAAAGLTLAASSAHALTYSNGDIFAGFRAVSGTGATLDYIINLGSISQYQPGGTLADGNPHSLNLSNLGADLTTNFGSWSTSGNFLFSVFGVVKPGATLGGTAYTNQTMFWGDAETTLGTPSTPQKGFAVGSLPSPTNNMVAVGNLYAGSTQTTETQAGGLLQSISSPNTYGNTTSNFSGSAYPNNKYFTLTPFKEPEANFSAGTPQVVDLYRLNPGNTGNGTLIGGFEIGSNGNITYSSDLTDFAPVPEPASVGTLFSAFLGVVALGKRRRAARAMQA